MGKMEQSGHVSGPLTYAHLIHASYIVNQNRIGLTQFHVNFDDFFESIKWEEFMPRFELQYKVRLLRERRSSTPDLDRGTMTKMLKNNRTSSNIDPGEANQNDNLDEGQESNIDADDEQMPTINYEEEEEQDSSNYHQETNANYNKETDQR